MIIKTATYPMGPAGRMDDGDIVQRINKRGRFVDTYIHDLIDGDEYYAPKEQDRTLSDMIEFIETHNISFMFEYDVDGYPVEVYALSFGECELARMEIAHGCEWFIGFMNYLMDLHEGIVHE